MTWPIVGTSCNVDVRTSFVGYSPCYQSGLPVTNRLLKNPQARSGLSSGQRKALLA